MKSADRAFTASPGRIPAATPRSLEWPPGGQGARGAAGYEDHGDSELFMTSVTPEKCRDIMTKEPVCCLKGDSAARAGRLMKEHDVGVLLVIADPESKKLAGIITDRDLVLRVVAEGIDHSAATVERAMSKPVITCSPDDGRFDTATDLTQLEVAIQAAASQR